MFSSKFFKVREFKSLRIFSQNYEIRLVMIWSFGGMAQKGAAETESWKCIHRLQGHDSDVIDLAWNRADKFLATASLDNSIMVWKGDAKFERVATLKGHTNFVKGIAWDPVGSYLGKI